MEYEDSRYALFTEPNAYIQRFDNCEKKETKKIVFQEPYENIPNFYIDNGFKKGDCDCVNKPKEDKKPSCPSNPFPFDFKNLLPLLASLGKGGGGLSNLISILGSNTKNGDENNSGFNLSNLMSLFNNSNSGGLNLNGLMNMFRGNKNTQKKKMQSTDFDIKNYKRVD